MTKFFKNFHENRDIMQISKQSVTRNEYTYNMTRFDVPLAHSIKSRYIIIAAATADAPKHLVASMDVLFANDVRLNYIRKCEAELTDALLAIRYGCNKFHRPLSGTTHAAILSISVESTYRNQGIATMLINALAESCDIIGCNYNAASGDPELMYTSSSALKGALKEQTKINADILKNHGWSMVPMAVLHHWHSLFAITRGHE